MKQMFMMKIGVLFLVVACLSCCSGHKAADGGDRLKCRSMKVEGGYGYVVLHGEDTLIYQPFIPAVGGRRPFIKREDALEAGKLVCRKFAAGLSPALSREEVFSCFTDTGACRD